MSGSDSPQNFWQCENGTLSFRSAEFAFRAVRPRGWVSWQVGGDEFLYSTPDSGGVFFRCAGADVIPRWVDEGNMTGDEREGRVGTLGDGIFSTRIITGWTLPRFELYAGFNLEEPHELVVLLHEDVGIVRCGDPAGPRALNSPVITRGRAAPPQDAGDGCTLVHRSGRALCVHAPCRIESVEMPCGKRLPALAFACNGHAANTFSFTGEPQPRSENLIANPVFQVDAPNAKPGNTPWALYEPETGVDFNFQFDWLGAEPFHGTFDVEFKYALGGTDWAGEHVISDADRDGSLYRIALKPQPRTPGGSEVWVRLLDAAGAVLHVERFRALYDWRNYRPNYFFPNDLKEFWDATLKELRATPLEAETTRVFEDFPDWELYTVSYRSWKGKRVYALMRVPKGAARPLPVLIASHPGGRGWGINRGPDGVYGSKINADPRFVTISPLVRGYEPDDPNIPFNHPWWGALDSRDDYVAREWYCTMVRGIDYMATRPELGDMSRLIVRGGSQGGALALITAALDQRVKWCLADSPSNCMLHDSIDPDRYRSFGPTAGQVPEGQTLDDLKRTLSYYDPANLAQFIECPTVIGVNVGDMCVHSLGGLSAYHNLQKVPADKKWFLPGIRGHAHSNSADGGAKMREVLDLVAGQSTDE